MPSNLVEDEEGLDMLISVKPVQLAAFERWRRPRSIWGPFEAFGQTKRVQDAEATVGEMID